MTILVREHDKVHTVSLSDIAVIVQFSKPDATGYDGRVTLHSEEIIWSTDIDRVLRQRTAIYWKQRRQERAVEQGQVNA